MRGLILDIALYQMSAYFFQLKSKFTAMKLAVDNFNSGSIAMPARMHFQQMLRCCSLFQ